jgi:hypothetical protein
MIAIAPAVGCSVGTVQRIVSPSPRGLRFSGLAATDPSHRPRWMEPNLKGTQTSWNQGPPISFFVKFFSSKTCPRLALGNQAHVSDAPPTCAPAKNSP